VPYTDGKGGKNPHLGKQDLWVLIARILSNLDQNGPLTIYPTSGSCISVAGIWMRMGTSQQGIPHIVIYPTIVHKPRYQLNPLSKSKFLSKKISIN